MSSILTVRLDDDLKKRGTETMLRYNYTPSQAVQRLFDYVVEHDALPFDDYDRPSEEEIRAMVVALDSFHTLDQRKVTDDEIREARLRERYGDVL